MTATDLKDDERTELRVSTGYFDKAIDDIATLLEEAREELADVEFDTLIATGLSGTCVAPILAHELGVHYLILRKPDDLSTHSSKRAVGHLGRRWVFLDDFISSGATRVRVHQQLAELVQDERPWEWNDSKGDYDRLAEWETEYVGTYEYSHGRFVPAHDSHTEKAW